MAYEQNGAPAPTAATEHTTAGETTGEASFTSAPALDLEDSAPAEVAVDAPQDGGLRSYTPTSTARKAKKSLALKFPRRFTTEGQDPFDTVEWEKRTASIVGEDGKIVFEQTDCEIPKSWSQLATNVVVSKYFRGPLGSAQREYSVRQVIGRVADTMHRWGVEGGYFASDEDAQAFRDELAYLLLHQYGSFNSPVWFNIGVEGAKQQASACQPYDALVSTPGGLIPIGKLVEDNAIGTMVYDARGVARILAVKANGVKKVLRLHTKAGYTLDVTPDHQVWKSTGYGKNGATGKWVESGELKAGDKVSWHRTPAVDKTQELTARVAEAALAGWLQSDGFVGRYEGTNSSLTAEAIVVNQVEEEWVRAALSQVFPDVHSHTREVETQNKNLRCRRIRLYGEVLAPFVADWNLLVRSAAVEVPPSLFGAPLCEAAAYLRSLFQAEGYVSVRDNAVVALDMISEKLVRGAQQLLLRFGIYARVRFKADARENRHGCWNLSIRTLGDRERFANEIGFLSADKTEKLNSSLGMKGLRAGDAKRLEIERIEERGEMPVYDIQTSSGEYLSGNIRVHNCFINSVDDNMESIMELAATEARLFKGGSGAGTNLWRIRSSKEHLSGGGVASGPVSFMRGWDAFAGAIKSGGTTRRAAKMVILNADHPDIEEFIVCKTDEEKKAWALIDAGYNGGFNVPGGAYDSVDFQNANHSVRVTDEFMRAAENNADWNTHAVMDGSVVETKSARDLLHKIAECTHICGDPGLQYDTTINDWHTSANTDRIYASNPCSEFLFLDDTACLAGETRISTPEGLRTVEELFRAQQSGERVLVTTDLVSEHDPRRLNAHRPAWVMETGQKPVFRVQLADGRRVRVTAEHRFLTDDGQWKRVDELQVGADRIALRQRGNSVAFSSDESDMARWRMLGWLTGDGVFSKGHTALVFGPQEAATAQVMEREFNSLLADALAYREVVRASAPALALAGSTPVADAATPTATLPRGGCHLSQQANGVWQITSKSRALSAYLQEWYGVREALATHKDVPSAVHRVADDLKVAYLQGLFSADGCIRRDVRGDNAEVMLASSSPELLCSVQLMLGDLGIASRIGWTHPAGRKNPQGQLHIYNQQARTFLALVGFAASPHKQARAEAILSAPFAGALKNPRPAKVIAIEADGVETVYDITEPVTHSFIAEGMVTHNCNLASLNLMKFRHDGATSGSREFNAAEFIHACETFITAMEIIVSNASYPTEKIAANSEDYRPLGLGFANLGALLMAQGTAYDSDEGRSLAGAITAIMTGAAYRQSARIAANIGPFNGYAKNREPMLRVIGKHRDCVSRIPQGNVPAPVLNAAQSVWDEALLLGQKHGYRNSQATVLAPTGTIAFMMDADTTGIEPDIALVKYKKLVGGGLLKIVNQTVPEALRKLGYDAETSKEIVAYIDANDTIEGAPGLKDEHLSVFDCAFKAMNGTRSIHHMGHVKMMAAAQPFISGAISKCVTGETLIACERGLTPIQSFYQGEKPGEFSPLRLQVASTGQAQETDLFYYGGVQPTIKLNLADGRSIEGTWVHRVKVASKDGYDWKRLTDITPDDYVAVRLGAEMWAQQDAPLNFSAPRPERNLKTLRVPQKMTPQLARFLGFYIAEGNITRSNWTLRITNLNATVLTQCLETVRAVFGLEGRIEIDARNGVTSFIVASKSLCLFMEHIGAGGNSASKRIPWSVLQSSRESLREFVGGLWLDGYVRGGDGMVAICLNSPALLRELQVVLNNFGLRAHIIRKWNACYEKHFHELGLHGADARCFGELFRLDDAHKTARLHALASKPKSVRAVHSDVVPCFRREIEAAIRGARETMAWRHVFDARTKHLSRDTVRAAFERFGLEELREIVEGNIHFVRVRDIAEGMAPVYDFQVPSNHAFLGNGIVNHNTVNVPSQASVEEIMDAYIQSWKLGIKAVAIYRDGSKRTQPLSTSTDAMKADAAKEAPRAVRRKLPDERAAVTHKFSIAGQEGYFTVGLYEDGSPGEIFIKMSKEGSTISGLMDSFAVAVSMCLQYGVPLRVLVNKFSHSRFEPSGYTTNKDIPIAKSLMDYIFRWFDLKFHPNGSNGHLGNRDSQVAAPAQSSLLPEAGSTPSLSEGVHETDAPPCTECGTIMVRAGKCYSCPSCGTTSGCG